MAMRVWRGIVLLLLAGVAGFGIARGVAQRAGSALRSAIVYPPARIALRMDHAHPAHRALRCQRCHEGATASTTVADVLIPEEAACAPCHEETDREQPSAERCGLCHVGSDGVRIPRSTFPSARLHFSHQQHARLGIRCLDCHEGVTEAGLATRRHLPTMESCWRCHNDRQAASDCGTCHLERPDGRLRQRFAEGVMLPPRWLHGMDHDRDFLVRHRWVAADDGETCAECHSESECAACHDGRVRPSSVHRNDFLTTHGPMARRDEPRCASCHTTHRFCTECHARMGLAPIAAPRAVAGGRFHPPGEVWLRAHATEARRSMNACASCHVERDCVVCHGSMGIGVGLSPHPPGFTASCGDALRRNARACRTCHGALGPLAERCGG